MTLDQLAIKYGSDKSSLSHNYTSFYEQRLPRQPKKLLEIGVLQGASIRMWKEYFSDCEIHALDLFMDNPIPDIEGVVWHKGNQLDYLLLEQLRKENFDFVVDDGSHNSRDQLITFFGLFNGNPYFIEDLQCCSEPFYRDGLPESVSADRLFSRLNHGDDLHIVRDCQSPIVLIQSV